jgi:hypothetical protein
MKKLAALHPPSNTSIPGLPIFGRRSSWDKLRPIEVKSGKGL